MPSDSKKNPGLGHLEEYYDTHFVSIFGYLLDYRGMWTLAFDNKQIKKGFFSFFF